jgi:hypothetical protein
LVTFDPLRGAADDVGSCDVRDTDPTGSSNSSSSAVPTKKEEKNLKSSRFLFLEVN